MNQQELQRILLMPEGLRAQYLAALKKPQKMSGGGEFGRKAQRINQATSFGDEPMGNQIVKDVGGNWLGGNVEKALDPLTRTVLNDTGVNNLRSRQGDEIADSYLKERPRHEAANNWVRGNLTNYVKKQMATEADPVRKLAEQGISHFPIAEDPRFWQRKGESARKTLSGRQVGKSDLAKQWENRSDSMIERDSAKGHQDMMHLSPGLYSEKDAWIKNAPPETKIYETSGIRSGFNAADLGFDHIMDVLKEDLAEGRIRPEQLSKISMEQAVRRVHEYDQDKLKKMREAQIKNTEGMPVHKVYDDGHKWIELAMPKGEAALSDLGKQIMAKHKAEGTEPSPGVLEQAIKQGGEEKLREALKYEGDTMGHCVGGYCPDVMEGRSRIFSLRDAKGEPHVTVETNPVPHPISTSRRGDNFPDLTGFEYGNKYSGPSPYKPTKEQLKQIHARAHELWRTQGTGRGMEIDDFSQQAANEILGSMPYRIVQIKGKGNGKPVAKYIPMVQDFVKSHSWADVGDLHNTDLIHLDPKSDLAQAIQANGEKPPRYITNQELTDLSKKHNFPTWVNNVQKKADGGAIHMNKGGSGHSFVKHKHGEKVGGYHVGEKINNYGSYESSGISKVLPGIHKVPMSSFETTHPNDLFYAKNDHDRVRHLAEQIKHNKYLDPLLVAMDEKGPYVLEGGHRLGAAHLLGMKEIPAMVGYEPKVEHLAPKAQGGLAHMNKGGALPKHERDANLAQFLKDSAVKDRMYHATHSDFNAFRNNHRGIHFVTPKPKFANDFLTNSGQDEHEEGANIMPVHVNAKNPFDYQNKQHVNALGVKASIGKLGLDEIKKGKWGRIEDRTTLKAIKDLGHDSVYVKENGIKNLGVFDPNQIKSAIGNRGTYDPNETDITKAKGGSIKPVGYTKEKVTVSPSLDRMQYELMSVKHFKKAK